MKNMIFLGLFGVFIIIGMVNRPDKGESDDELKQQFYSRIESNPHIIKNMTDGIKDRLMDICSDDEMSTSLYICNANDFKLLKKEINKAFAPCFAQGAKMYDGNNFNYLIDNAQECVVQNIKIITPS